MGSSLDQLPPELFAHIFCHLGTARDLLHLSLTCKQMHALIENDGFRVFVLSHFPSFQLPPYWKEAAHAMTTLSRNWDRKAFVARRISPKDCSKSNSSRGRAPPRRQTMGYQPVIDSYEEWIGNDWASRRQVLTWGAGPDLILRLKAMGDEAKRIPQDADAYWQENGTRDQHHHVYKWATLRDKQFEPGKDDIRSVNLLRPTQKLEYSLEYVIVGRASGTLDLVTISALDGSSVSKAEFDTGARPLRDATTNEAPNPLLATCFYTGEIALYPVRFGDESVKALDESSVYPPTVGGRIWSCRFLRNDLLALGLGPSKTPMHVYDIQPDGFSDQPIRKFAFGIDDSRGLDTGSGFNTVYPIEPIAAGTAAGRSDGVIFLSGGFDGHIRYVPLILMYSCFGLPDTCPLSLHDLRSPAPYTAIFTDPVDSLSSIYSLVSLGRERFIAGGSRYSIIKVFDLRLPGGKVYYAADLDPCISKHNALQSSLAPLQAKTSLCCQFHHDARWNRRNYNIFTGYSRHHPVPKKSPVYSLSSPSPCSPTVFVGTENDVLQLDVVSAMDRHPDPIFQTKSEGRENQHNLKERWDPYSDVVRLSLYEHSTDNIIVNVQCGIDHALCSRTGWDERWSAMLS